ncbi:MAG: 3-phosphoshikimate 1-carboxyvinyltransferase [Candidatus Poribacteria bacterium]|nr:3-phosphoshikimate 1-carboxyvinyltransferase [Candidatus Poribacteria bacterium]MDE0503065.1 3-phosphoshikimate 1-carboxyvinyltransferase [Candidatus Poribacteria bacterium]
MLEIEPIRDPVDAIVTVPGSKSYTNRALLIASLAKGHSRLTGALFSDDTRYMYEALRKLGIAIAANEDRCSFDVVGSGGKIPVNRADLYVGNSGTTTRSLVSYVGLGKGEYLIDGDEPMRRSRPISDLLDCLRQIGVNARSQYDNGCLPVIVCANGLQGGRARLNASKSSQFLTSLMLVAPYAVNGLEIEIIDKLKKPYIDITISVMETFGVQVVNHDYRYFQIASGQKYEPREYAIEPDASSASYFFAAAALTGGRVRVNNLTSDSTQGDTRFVDILEKMGCRVNRNSSGIEVMGPEQLTGIDVDMNAISDTALTLAAIAPFAGERVVIRNIQHTRWQETDRIHAMVTELRKLGVHVVEHQDGVEIYPSEIKSAEIDTYNDHRVAMSFSLIGLKVPGIRIKNPDCVSKTFPTYFDVLASLRQPVHRTNS